MKRLFLVGMVLVGCGSGPDDSTHRDHVTDWQGREAMEPMVITDCRYSGNLSSDIDYIVSQAQAEYKKDQGENWKTSRQTQNDGFGDCEDRANLILRAVTDSCLMEHYDIDPRCRIVAMPKGDHVQTIIYDNASNDVYTIEGMAVSRREGLYDVLLEYDREVIF